MRRAEPVKRVEIMGDRTLWICSGLMRWVGDIEGWSYRITGLDQSNKP